MAKVKWNAVLIIKDYHLLLLDYHILGIVHGIKIIAPCCTLLELCWNGVHEDFKGQQEHRQARHICTTASLTAKGPPI